MMHVQAQTYTLLFVSMCFFSHHIYCHRFISHPRQSSMAPYQSMSSINVNQSIHECHRCTAPGLAVDEADNGAQAVEMAIRRFDRNAPYDAIIMDYTMPRMDGPTATMALRTMGYDGN